MAKGIVNTPGRIGYNVAKLSERVEETLEQLQDVAASCLTLGTTGMGREMLDGTFDYNTVVAPAFAIGTEDIGAAMLNGTFDYNQVVGAPAEQLSLSGAASRRISN